MNKIILYTSEQAEKLTHGIKGWFGRHIKYYRGTHRPCEDCGEIIEKSRTCCDSCRDSRSLARYLNMEAVEWDGETLLYSEVYGDYFSDWDDIGPIIEAQLEDPRLVICEPVYLSPVESDYWSDDLPEDGEFPDELARALDKFNALLRAHGPVSWMPGKFRAILVF